MEIVSEEKVFNKVNTLTSAQMASIQYFWHDSAGAHVSNITQETYNNASTGTICIEVLITSSSMTFRRGYKGTSWQWTVYATYANIGITLGDYASMTDAGIILGDITNTDYQLKLNSSQGLLLNGSPIIISEYATQEIVESSTTTRYCAGMLSSDAKTVRFTVPLECIVPEGTSVNITTLMANIKVAGTNYCLDYPYTNGGVYFSGGTTYTITGQVVGTSMTINISKNSAFTQNHTTTSAVGNSAVVVELTGFRWIKPAMSRNTKKVEEKVSPTKDK